MNAKKLTNILFWIGTPLFIAGLIAGNIWGGKAWIYVVVAGSLLIITRMAYEMIHFSEYKENNIRALVSIPLIFIVILILQHLNVI